MESGRGSVEPVKLDVHGFELRQSATEHEDFYDKSSVVGKYYPECERIVRAATGASFVAAFDHNVRGRSITGRSLPGGTTAQGPAPAVHGDYTLTSAPQRLADLGQPPKVNDVLRSTLGDKPLLSEDLCRRVLEQGSRFAIINVWRNIRPEPVQNSPLGCCDARTVAAEDLVVFELRYADRIGENYFVVHNPAHRWFYFPHMTRDEALLIKQWDSAGTFARQHGGVGDAGHDPVGGEDDAHGGDFLSTFAAHSAFADPTSTPGAPERESIEVRCMVVY
eukprot:jgi/Mesvir1/26521/Mv16177-RA.1